MYPVEELMVSRIAVNLCFSTQLFGRALFMLILLIAPIALFYKPFEMVLLFYILFVIFFLFIFALPIYIWGFFQKCPKCKKRILVLKRGQRRPEFVKGSGWWYTDFGELIDIIRTKNLPCHHCGNLHNMAET